jgi:hypothetical protein
MDDSRCLRRSKRWLCRSRRRMEEMISRITWEQWEIEWWFNGFLNGDLMVLRWWFNGDLMEHMMGIDGI